MNGNKSLGSAVSAEPQQIHLVPLQGRSLVLSPGNFRQRWSEGGVRYSKWLEPSGTLNDRKANWGSAWAQDLMTIPNYSKRYKVICLIPHCKSVAEAALKLRWPGMTLFSPAQPAHIKPYATSTHPSFPGSSQFSDSKRGESVQDALVRNHKHLPQEYLCQD